MAAEITKVCLTLVIIIKNIIINIVQMVHIILPKQMVSYKSSLMKNMIDDNRIIRNICKPNKHLDDIIFWLM